MEPAKIEKVFQGDMNKKDFIYFRKLIESSTTKQDYLLKNSKKLKSKLDIAFQGPMR